MVWKEPGKDKDPWETAGSGSPDLEKLVGELHKRFSSLFGRRRRRGHPTGVLLWLIPLVAVAWSVIRLLPAWRTGDRGVDLLLGRFRYRDRAGLHWHVPWPLGATQIVSGVDQGADYYAGYGVLPTADGNAVSVEDLGCITASRICRSTSSPTPTPTMVRPPFRHPRYSR